MNAQKTLFMEIKSVSNFLMINHKFLATVALHLNKQNLNDFFFIFHGKMQNISKA